MLFLKAVIALFGLSLVLAAPAPRTKEGHKPPIIEGAESLRESQFMAEYLAQFAADIPPGITFRPARYLKADAKAASATQPLNGTQDLAPRENPALTYLVMRIAACPNLCLGVWNNYNGGLPEVMPCTDDGARFWTKAGLSGRYMISFGAHGTPSPQCLDGGPSSANNPPYSWQCQDYNLNQQFFIQKIGVSNIISWTGGMCLTVDTPHPGSGQAAQVGDNFYWHGWSGDHLQLWRWEGYYDYA